MAQLLVRQPDDSAVERLKRKAAARGASLEALAREVLTREAQDDRATLVRELDALRPAQPPQTSDPTAYIRARRDGVPEDEIP